MRRIDLFLFGVLVVCALAVVHTQHRARRLFVDVEHERTTGEQLATDLRRLQAEQAKLASANQVERAASGMHMHLPEPGRSYALAGPLAPLAGLTAGPTAALAPGLTAGETVASGLAAGAQVAANAAGTASATGWPR